MRFLKNIGWATLAQLAASAAAFAYTLITAHTLGLQHYGLFQAAMGVFWVFSFIHIAFYFGCLHCAGRAAPENKEKILGVFFTLSLITAGLVFMLFSLSAETGRGLLKTSESSAWLACGALIAANTVLTLFHGYIQSEHKFKMFSLAKIAEALLVLLAGTYLMRAGWGPTGAILGYVCAMTAILLFFVVTLRPRFFSWPEAKNTLRHEWPSLKKITYALAFLLILENAPAICARFFLAPDQSGYFGAIYNLRSTVWPFAMAYTLTFYAHLLAGDTTAPLLRNVLLLITGLATAFQTAAVFFARPLIELLYGPSFTPAAALLPYYGITLTLMMVVMLMLFYHLGLSQLKKRTLGISLLAFTAGLVFCDKTISGIITAQALGAATCLVGLLWNRRPASNVKP